MQKPKVLILLMIVLLLALLVAGCSRGAADNAVQTPAPHPTVEGRKSGDPKAETNKQQEEVLSKLREMTAIFDEENTSIIDRIRALSPFVDLIKEHPHLNDDYGLQLELYKLKASKEDIPIMRNFLEGPISSNEREVALYFLATTSYVNGDVDSAWSYYTMLTESNTFGIFAQMFREEDVALMNRAYKEQRAILAHALPEDERLWLLGKLYTEVLRQSWNVNNGVFYDLSYGCRLLERVVKKYPQSKWADDAQFELIVLDEWYDEGDGDQVVNWACVEKYTAFVAKYPDSVYVPDATLEIAEHYCMSSDLTVLEKAKALVAGVLKNDPNAHLREKADEVAVSIKMAVERAKNASETEGQEP